MNSQQAFRAGGTKIRAAQFNDARALAQVDIQCWQETYQGLMAQDNLDKLPSKLASRVAGWEQTLRSPQQWTWVVDCPTGLAGFVVFCLPRDYNREGYIELGASYLLAAEQGKGLGFSLLSTAFSSMKTLGYRRVYGWTLEGNPVVKFYEKLGASFTESGKHVHIGGIAFELLMYEWGGLKPWPQNSVH